MFIISVAITSIVVNSYSSLMFDIEIDRNSFTGENRTICTLKKVDRKYIKFYKRIHVPFQFAVTFILPTLLIWFFNCCNIRTLLTRNSELLRRDLAETASHSSDDNISFRVKPSSSYRRSPSKLSLRDKLKDSNRATTMLILITVFFICLNLPYVIGRVIYLDF